jgi:hypothetical protein
MWGYKQCQYYELAARSKDVIYVGEGKLRDRLLAHFASGSDPIPGISYFKYETTRSKDRCKQRQNALLAEYEREYGRLPTFNQKSSA